VATPPWRAEGAPAVRWDGDPVELRLARIRHRARTQRRERLNNLYTHLDAELLLWAYEQLDAGKAVGVDGISVEEYGQGLEGRLSSLLDRLHQGSYRPQPSRRRWIPKGDGRMRPLGIPATEDKIVQRALSAVLAEVFEEEFCDFSYGFRPGRGCHDALRGLARHIAHDRVNWVVEADIKGFFDAVNHDWLLKMVAERVSDKRVLRLIRRMLMAGVMEEGRRRETEAGTPQGGVISPLLANIYLHYVLDLWFAKVVKSHCQGEAYLVRYADDFVACFQYETDARRFRAALDERLGKFHLEIEPTKTRVLRFGRFAKRDAQARGEQLAVFDFLGFTHYCGTNQPCGPVQAQMAQRQEAIPSEATRHAGMAPVQSAHAPRGALAVRESSSSGPLRLLQREQQLDGRDGVPQANGTGALLGAESAESTTQLQLERVQRVRRPRRTVTARAGGEPESGAECVKMVAGSRMRERRTSGSERGRGINRVGGNAWMTRRPSA
jgi:RNA-directed DNA polymerase